MPCAPVNCELIGMVKLLSFILGDKSLVGEDVEGGLSLFGGQIENVTEHSLYTLLTNQLRIVKHLQGKVANKTPIAFYKIQELDTRKM